LFFAYFDEIKLQIHSDVRALHEDYFAKCWCGRGILPFHRDSQYHSCFDIFCIFFFFLGAPKIQLEAIARDV